MTRQKRMTADQFDQMVRHNGSRIEADDEAGLQFTTVGGVEYYTTLAPTPLTAVETAAAVTA